MPNTGCEPNAQLKGPVRCQLVEVDLGFYSWLRDAKEENELDTMAYAFVWRPKSTMARR